MTGNKMLVAVVLLAAVLLTGCTVIGSGASPNPVQLGWMGLSLTVVFGMYLAVGILYMIGTGFGMPGLIAWCKNELFQITATAIMVFMLAFALTSIDQFTRGVVAPEIITAYDIQPGDYALMKAAQGYMLCQSDFIWSTYKYIVVTTAPIQILYSSTIHIRPLKMGFSLQPGKFLQPIMDNVNIAITMLASATWASKLIYMLLLFSEDVMFAIFLPLGVLLRSFPMTRSVGGALIALAVALYVALPAAILINSVIYEEHYGGICIPGGFGTTWSRIVSIGGGWKNYAFDAMFAGTGGAAPAIFGKFGIFAYGAMAFLFGGLSGMAPWLIAGAVVGGLTAWMLAWTREIIFLVVILGFVGMVIDYMVTFTFARELGKILGADVNLSALMKIL
jgi:hypothetical protein